MAAPRLCLSEQPPVPHHADPPADLPGPRPHRTATAFAGEEREFLDVVERGVIDRYYRCKKSYLDEMAETDRKARATASREQSGEMWDAFWKSLRSPGETKTEDERQGGLMPVFTAFSNFERLRYETVDGRTVTATVGDDSVVYEDADDDDEG